MSTRKEVSVDFDDTLTKPSVSRYVFDLIQNDVIVHITTSRFDDAYLKQHKYPWSNKDLYRLAKTLGVDRSNIVFTNHEWKAKYLATQPQILWHLDDNIEELYHINKETKIKGLSVLSGTWKNKCEKFLRI